MDWRAKLFLYERSQSLWMKGCGWENENSGRTPDLLGLGDRLAQFARDGHGLERGADDLRRARLLRGVLGLGLEQLGVREYHAELVVQPVEEFA